MFKQVTPLPAQPHKKSYNNLILTLLKNIKEGGDRADASTFRRLIRISRDLAVPNNNNISSSGTLSIHSTPRRRDSMESISLFWDHNFESVVDTLYEFLLRSTEDKFAKENALLVVKQLLLNQTKYWYHTGSNMLECIVDCRGDISLEVNSKIQILEIVDKLSLYFPVYF